MRNLILTLSLSLVFIACQQQARETREETTEQLPSTGIFGDSITAEGAIDASEAIALLDQADSVQVKLTGKVIASCQKSGCWMDLDMGNGQVIKISFMDDALLIPKDASGKTAVVEGWAYKELIDVETLKHYAKDDGKTAEEIDAITEPEMSYTFLARGVIISE